MNARYDTIANAKLLAFLNEAEVNAVRLGQCQRREANRWLAIKYIEACGQMHQHAQVYLTNEERLAAVIFLSTLTRRGMKARLGRSLNRCAVQLATHTALYLTDFEALLEIEFMKFMAKSPTLEKLKWSGLVKQALAVLPREVAINVVQRELRRLGYEREALLIPCDEYLKRQSYRSPQYLLS